MGLESVKYFWGVMKDALYYKNGDKYIGEWNNNRDGYGVMTWMKRKSCSFVMADSDNPSSQFSYEDCAKSFHGIFKQGIIKSGKLEFYDTDKIYNGPYGSKGEILGKPKSLNQISNNTSHSAINTTTEYYEGTYVGEMVNGKRQGKGTFYCNGKGLRFDKGDKYVGQWNNNVREGKGVFYAVSGAKFAGYYQNDEMKKGIAYLANGDKYIGGYKNSKRHGYGKYYYGSGDIYEGNFINNRQEGKALYTKRGIKYNSKWRKGNMVSYRRIKNSSSTGGILNGGIIGAGLALWAGAAIKQAFTGRISAYDSKNSSSSKNSNSTNSNNQEHSSSSLKKDMVSSNSSCSYKVNRIKNTDTPRKSKGKQIKCSNGEYITVAKYYKKGKWKKESDIIGARWFNTFDDVAEHVCGCD